MASNNFYKVVNLIKKRLDDNQLLNTTIFAKTNEKDLYKKQIYPLAHIVPVVSPFSTKQTNQFTFEIGVLTQRDISSVKKDTKFEGDDNIIDNMNTCYFILSDLISYLYNRDTSDDRIELVAVSSFTPLLFTDFNILDGWVISITLEAPNDDICYE